MTSHSVTSGPPPTPPHNSSRPSDNVLDPKFFYLFFWGGGSCCDLCPVFPSMGNSRLLCLPQPSAGHHCFRTKNLWRRELGKLRAPGQHPRRQRRTVRVHLAWLPPTCGDLASPRSHPAPSGGGDRVNTRTEKGRGGRAPALGPPPRRGLLLPFPRLRPSGRPRPQPRLAAPAPPRGPLPRSASGARARGARGAQAPRSRAGPRRLRPARTRPSARAGGCRPPAPAARRGGGRSARRGAPPPAAPPGARAAAAAALI